MGKHGFIENADRLIRWAQLQLQYSVVGSDKIEQEHAISYDSAYFVHWVHWVRDKANMTALVLACDLSSELHYCAFCLL